MPFKVYIASANIEIENLDPAKTNYFREQLLLSNLTETLLKVDSRGQIQANIAKEWYVSENGKKIKFVIDSNFKSSSGKKISTHDISASLKRLCILKKNTHFAIYDFLKGADQIKKIEDDIKGIEIINQHEITLSFTQKIHDILIKLAHQEFAILPEESINKNIHKIDWQTTFGAYYISNTDEGKTILAYNPYYKHFDAESLKEIWILNVTKDTTNLNFVEQVELGNFHFLVQILPLNYNFDNLKMYKNIDILSRQFVTICFLSLNSQDSFLKNHSVRADLRDRILSSSFPKENFFIKKAFSIFPSGLLGTTIIKTKINSKEKYENEINLKITLANGYKNQLENILKHELKKVGINLSFDYKDFKLVDKAVFDSNYQSALIVSGMSARFPDAFFKFFIKNKWLNDPTKKLKKMYENMILAENYYEKSKSVVEATNHLIEQGTFIPLYFQRMPFFINKDYKVSDVESFSENISFIKIKRN